MTTRSMGITVPVQTHADPPPPPFGGGADNPPPPDEQHEFSQRTRSDDSEHHEFSQRTQSDDSPSLLTPTLRTNEEGDTANAAGDTGFIRATTSRGLRTTPPHAAVVHPTAPSPTTTANSFAALYPPDSPPSPPSPDAPAPPPPSSPRAIGFLTSFLENWPESDVSDDTT